jgi:hypothetical protein
MVSETPVANPNLSARVSLMFRVCEAKHWVVNRMALVIPDDKTVRREILLHAALTHLVGLYQVLLRSPLCWFGLFPFSAASGGHCRHFPPTSYSAGRLIHSGAFAQAHPGPRFPDQHLRLGVIEPKSTRQLADPCELLVPLTLSDGRLLWLLVDIWDRLGRILLRSPQRAPCTRA